MMKIFQIIADVINDNEDITLDNKLNAMYFIEANDVREAIRLLSIYYAPKNEDDNWNITISAIQELKNPPIIVLKPQKYLGRDIGAIETLISPIEIDHGKTQKTDSKIQVNPTDAKLRNTV